MQAQFAHSTCFNVSARTQALKVTGHVPYNAQQMFLRHPGMSLLDESVRARCLEVVHGKLKQLFWEKGWIGEDDLDRFNIPETEEQAAARAAGKRVKWRRSRVGVLCGSITRERWK